MMKIYNMEGFEEGNFKSFLCSLTKPFLLNINKNNNIPWKGDKYKAQGKYLGLCNLAQ